jgi:hypothetical protein
VGKRPGENWFIRKKRREKLDYKKGGENKHDKRDCHRSRHMAYKQADGAFFTRPVGIVMMTQQKEKRNQNKRQENGSHPAGRCHKRNHSINILEYRIGKVNFNYGF